MRSILESQNQQGIRKGILAAEGYWNRSLFINKPAGDEFPSEG